MGRLNKSEKKVHIRIDVHLFLASRTAAYA